MAEYRSSLNRKKYILYGCYDGHVRIANNTHKKRAKTKSQKAPADRGWPFQLDGRLILQHRAFWDILMIVFVGSQPQHGGGATEAQDKENKQEEYRQKTHTHLSVIFKGNEN